MRRDERDVGRGKREKEKERKWAFIRLTTRLAPTPNPTSFPPQAYVDFFSRSLAAEMSQFGVHVQCQSPFLVVSKLSGVKRASIDKPEPETYAKAAIADIGSGVSTVPYWPHTVQDSVLAALPTSLVASQILKMHTGLRSRYFSNKAKQAAKEAQAGTKSSAHGNVAFSEPAATEGKATGRSSSKGGKNKSQ
jgi:17beta-estradiol 17-dehydrogenase / very-long-chain 3-oxoacyl-CoA reductase